LLVTYDTRLGVIAWGFQKFFLKHFLLYQWWIRGKGSTCKWPGPYFQEAHA